MDLESRGMRQHLLGRRQYERIHHQIPASFGTRYQSTRPARPASRKIVAAGVCRRDVWLQLLRRPIHDGRGNETIDNRASIFADRRRDLVGGCGCGNMSDAH